MTYNIIKTLLIALFAYQCFVAVPHDYMTTGCFTGDDHYPAWYRFPELRLRALGEVTRPGTSIGCFGRPLQDRSMALWNPTFSNEVVVLPKRIEEYGMQGYPDWVSPVEDPPGSDNWVIDSIPIWMIVAMSECDYIYLRPGDSNRLSLDKKAIRWCENHPNRVRFIYSDGWGRFYEVLQ